MKLIERILQKKVYQSLSTGKVTLIYGARRVGKTVLLKQIVSEFPGKALVLNGEDNTSLKLLEERSIVNYKRLTNGVSLLVIDEAQNIPDIGMKLKLMADELSGVSILASGSSAMKLLNQVMEPLTGRCSVFPMFPIAQAELMPVETFLNTGQNLEDRLVYGSYPEVILAESADDKRNYLNLINESHLYKDVLTIDGIRNTGKVKDLLRLIAFQTGSEVSNEELGRQLSLSKNTVEKYLDILNKTQIIFNLTGFSKNLRKEVRRHSKWYFCDNGTRNAAIDDFRPLSLRTDTGSLWENYLIAERLKKISYNNEPVSLFFWRTYDQQEIDVVERTAGTVSAYEIKWNDQKFKIPAAWKSAYPEAGLELITRSNYLDWII